MVGATIADRYSMRDIPRLRLSLSVGLHYPGSVDLMSSAFDDGFRREWFMHSDLQKADEACYSACGMHLYDAWSDDRGCYVGGSWMNPSGIARAIAYLVFGWRDDDE